MTCPGLRGHSWDLNPGSPGLRFQTYTVALLSTYYVPEAGATAVNAEWEWGQGAARRLLGGGDWESTQRLSSLDPCLGRCLPAAHLRHPRRPRALRAQDQAADPEAEAPSPEDALPAAWGPQAALCPQQAPRPGAAAGRLWPGRALQEGQDEEEDVKKMAQPPAPPGSKCEHQHMLLRAAMCLALCRAFGKLPAEPPPMRRSAVGHRSAAASAETGTFVQGLEGCIGVCALSWRLGPCCFCVLWVQRWWSHRPEP